MDAVFILSTSRSILFYWLRSQPQHLFSLVKEVGKPAQQFYLFLCVSVLFLLLLLLFFFVTICYASETHGNAYLNLEPRNVVITLSIGEKGSLRTGAEVHSLHGWREECKSSLTLTTCIVWGHHLPFLSVGFLISNLGKTST